MFGLAFEVRLKLCLAALLKLERFGCECCCAPSRNTPGLTSAWVFRLKTMSMTCFWSTQVALSGVISVTQLDFVKGNRCCLARQSGIVRSDLCHADWLCQRQSLLSCMTNWHCPRKSLLPCVTKLALSEMIFVTLWHSEIRNKTGPPKFYYKLGKHFDKRWIVF